MNGACSCCAGCTGRLPACLTKTGAQVRDHSHRVAVGRQTAQSADALHQLIEEPCLSCRWSQPCGQAGSAFPRSAPSRTLRVGWTKRKLTMRPGVVKTTRVRDKLSSQPASCWLACLLACLLARRYARPYSATKPTCMSAAAAGPRSTAEASEDLYQDIQPASSSGPLQVQHVAITAVLRLGSRRCVSMCDAEPAWGSPGHGQLASLQR